MKRLFLFLSFSSIFTFSSFLAASGNTASLEGLGKNLSKASFGLGCLASLAFVAEKHQLGFGLGSLGLGSLLLSPLAEEVYHPTNKFTMHEIKKFRKLIPCGVGGFIAITIGIKTLLDAGSQALDQIQH